MQVGQGGLTHGEESMKCEDENENIYFKGAGIVEGRLKQKQKAQYKYCDEIILHFYVYS